MKASMERQRVAITVRGVAQDADEQTIEQSYQGYYAFRNNTHFISYEEFSPQEGDSAPRSSTLLKIKGNAIELVKKGALTTRMVFDTQNHHDAAYQTPYGTFQLRIVTERLSVRRDGQDFHIQLQYSLHLDDKPLSQNNTEISIQF